METKQAARTINIYCNNVWAGCGKLVDGVIEDCPAVLGRNQDDSDWIYEHIQNAIADGPTKVIDRNDTYTWVIE